jgi:hypothetical protein
MVTATRSDGNNEISTFNFSGLSSDDKPTGTYNGIIIRNGSTFMELDTQDIYFYDAENSAWLTT